MDPLSLSVGQNSKFLPLFLLIGVTFMTFEASCHSVDVKSPAALIEKKDISKDKVALNPVPQQAEVIHTQIQPNKPRLKKTQKRRARRRRPARNLVTMSDSILASTTATPESSMAPENESAVDWVPGNSTEDQVMIKRLKRDYPEGGYESPAFRHVYDSCAKSKKWGASRTPLNHLDPFPYIYESDHLCRGQVDLLIAIHTNPRRVERRRLIRATWGGLRQIGDQRIVLAFFAAGGLNSTHQEIMNNESRRFGDIIQRDFVENYRNLTYKHLNIMEWILEHCKHAKYLLKVDDDTFVDPFHVVRFTALHQPAPILCRVIEKAKPFRTKVNHVKKWNVSFKEYSDHSYPSYCEGFAYLLDIQEVRNLYWCGMFTKFFWIDDVFVSGILADRLGLNREMYWKGHYFDWMRPSHASDLMLDFMVLSVKENVVFSNIYHDIWRGVIQRQVSFL